MAIFNSIGQTFTIKTPDRFYTAGRVSYSSNEYFLKYSVDAKNWINIDISALEFSELTSLGEYNGMLVLTARLSDGNGAAFLSRDTFSTYVRHTYPSVVKSLEWDGATGFVGILDTMQTQQVCNLIIGENPEDEVYYTIKLPDFRVAGFNPDVNNIFMDGNTFVYYDRTAVYTSNNGIDWRPIYKLPNAVWITKVQGTYFWRWDSQNPNTGVMTPKFFRSTDFITITEMPSLTGNIVLTNKGLDPNILTLRLWRSVDAKFFIITPAGVITEVSSVGIGNNGSAEHYTYNPTTGIHITYSGDRQYYSSDGITWTYNSLNRATPRAVAYIGNYFIEMYANFGSSFMKYSADGISWIDSDIPNQIESPNSSNFDFVKSTNGTLYFYRSNYDTDTFWTTQDGLVWMQQQSPLVNVQYSLIFVPNGNALNAFITRGNNTILRTKTSLASPVWSGMTDNDITSYVSLRQLGSDGAGTVYATTDTYIPKDGLIYKSVDAGKTFTPFNSPVERSRLSNRMIIKIGIFTYMTGTAYNESGETEIGLYRTTNYETWEKIDVDIGSLSFTRFDWININFNGDMYIIAINTQQFYQGNQILVTSRDLITWNSIALNAPDSAIDWVEESPTKPYLLLSADRVAHSPKTILSSNIYASSRAAPFASDITGEIWTQAKESNLSQIYGTGELLATTANSNNYIFSRDGIEWFEPANEIYNDNGTDSCPIYTTTDRLFIYSFEYDDMMDFILTEYDYSGEILQKYSIAQFEYGEIYTSITMAGFFKGRHFVLLNSNTIYTSVDKINWTIATKSDPDEYFINYYFTDVGHTKSDQTIVILKQGGGTIWVSDDTVDWTLVTINDNPYTIGQSIQYSKSLNKFIFSMSVRDESVWEEYPTILMYQSSDALTWTPMDPPQTPEPVPNDEYTIRQASTDEADLIFIQSNNDGYRGYNLVWKLVDGVWEELIYGDSPDGWYVAGTQANVPPFSGIFTNQDTKDILLVCSFNSSSS